MKLRFAFLYLLLAAIVVACLPDQRRAERPAKTITCEGRINCPPKVAWVVIRCEPSK